MKIKNKRVRVEAQEKWMKVKDNASVSEREEEEHLLRAVEAAIDKEEE